VAHDISQSGLSEPLAAAAHAAGYERLTPLQAAALPVLRRGGNAVLHASAGAGVTAAFALPLLDRLVESERAEAGENAGPRALVLVPTAERAGQLAAALGALADATGLAVRAAAPGWHAQGADVLVATPDRALAQLQTSALKLEGVRALVLVELAGMFELYGADALATLAGLAPRDAQRIVTAAELTAEVEAFVEGHARRALTIPSRPADPRDVQQREPIGQIGYLVAGDAEKTELVARLLDNVETNALVRTRTARRAEHVQRELGRRGITAAAGAAIRVVGFDSDAATAERVISYDVPFSADELRSFHRDGGTVMVTPAELPHFRRIAGEVPFTLKQRQARTFELTEIDGFRRSIRAALEAEDVQAQVLVLEPLLEEYSPVEIAAALSALLRRRTPVRQAEAPAPEAGAAPGEASSGGFTRLFISIGERDNVRPGDIVGAITGEAGIRGDQVGRVDIRDTFSVVEIATAAAERVIRALNGTTMRGRSLRVDFDRKTAGGDSGRSAGPRGPRTPGGGPRAPGGSSRPAGGGPRRRPT
jgi:ATP-dependent RNA helicase DeaD